MASRRVISGGGELSDAPAQRGSPCQTCPTSGCCTVFDPELTGPDLARLTTALGMPAAVFAAARPVHSGQAGPDGLCLGTVETWELRLRRSVAGDATLGEGGSRRCLFLMHLGPGLNRCGVYAIRPMICRTFPTAVTATGVVAGSPAVCPDKAWDGVSLDAGAIVAAHADADAERQRWRAFLRVWNAAGAQSQLALRTREAALQLLFMSIIAFEHPPDDEISFDDRALAAISAAFRAQPPQR